MKERTNPKSVAPHKVKGTVLFTVVIVMMVLIVFLMGALALSATANKRAMKNYNSVQTQATAKAGVRALLSTIQNDVTFAGKVAGLKSGSAPITFGADEIQFESIGYDKKNGTYSYKADSSLGKIKEASVSYVGSKYVIEDGKPAEKAVIKFSATAEQGLEESTVAVYMLRSIDGKVEDNPPGGGGGFVSTGSIQQDNHTSAFGGTYVGFNNTGTKVDFRLGNPAVLETPIHVNGSLIGAGTAGSGQLNVVIRKPGDGLTVWGDLDYSADNNSFCIVSNFANTADLAELDYKQIPYIYVDGEFKLGQNANNKVGAAEIPLNIFCGKFTHTTLNPVQIYADMYCYDDEGISTFQTNGSPGSKLLEWEETIIDPDNTSGKVHYAGNFYTKGNLDTIGPGQSGNISFDRSVYVDGNLHVGPNITTTVGGDLYVNGTMNIEGTLKVTGELHAVSDIPSGKGSRASFVPVTNELKAGYDTKVVDEETEVPDGPKYKYAILNPDKSVLATDEHGSWGIGDSPSIEGTKLKDSWGNEKDIPGVTITEGCTVVVDYQNMKKVVAPVTKYYKIPDDTHYVSYAEAHSAGTNFPAYYEKDVILGNEKFDGKDGQIVKTVKNIMDELKPYNLPKNYPSKLKDSVEKNTLNLGSGDIKNGQNAGAITGSGNSYTITESCTISGSSNGVKLHINPGTKNIWVLLDGDMTLGEIGGNASQIIVDDTDGGTVSFLINKNVTFATCKADQPPILSKKFDDKMKASGDFEIVTDEKCELGIDRLDAIGIFIYSTEGEHKLEFQNQLFVTANICSPYLTVKFGDGAVTNLYDVYGKTGRIYYDGYQVIKKDSKSDEKKKLYGTEDKQPIPEKIGVVGCCICKDFQCTNDWDLLYVPSAIVKEDDPKTPEEDALMTGWKLLYYENY